MTEKPNLLTALQKPGILPKNELEAYEAWISSFFPFQREWLLEPSRFAICLKARQIGISHTTGAAAVLWGAALGETTTIISVGEREAREVLDKSFLHAQVLQKLGSNWAKCKKKGDGIVFDNGGRILALPSSSGGRGFTGNVFLDEYAYLEKPELVWDGAAAVAFHGYRIRVSSTPNGVGNAFHNLWTSDKASAGWAKYCFDIHRAQADGMKVDLGACWKMAKGDKRVFSQLFECNFLDGNEQYIPTEFIQDAVLDDTAVHSGIAYAGLDVGLKNDLSVLVIVRQTPDNRVWVQRIVIGKRTDWEDIRSKVFQAFIDWDIKKLCVDHTGIGHGMCEYLEKKLGKHRVTSVDFSLQKKEILATDLYQGFADKMIKIPCDRPLIQELCSLRRIITAAGNVRYDAARTDEGHADRAWALALAIHACSTKPANRIEKGPGDYSNT